jgi:hypothetical protein
MASLLKSRRAWALAVVAVLLVYPMWYFTAYQRGMLMAHIDHARGHDEVQTYGLPVPLWTVYANLLKDRYDVDLHPVAGCVVDDQLVWYVGGYNSVSCRLIEQKHGRNIFQECQALAAKKWRDEHPEEFKRFFGGTEGPEVP